MKRWILFIVLSLTSSGISQTQTGLNWIPLENLSDQSVLQTLERELKKYEPFLLDDSENKSRADQIESDVRLFIQQEEQRWQSRFAQVFAAVSGSYNKKLGLEASLRFAIEDLTRLKNSLDNFTKQIQAQQSVIQNSEDAKKEILAELSKKLETIPFYVVMFGSVEYGQNRTPKEMERFIFSGAREKAVEAVNGVYIQAETQVEQYQVVKDRITATISGRVQPEQTTNNFFVKVLTGTVNKISVVGLLAVYAWSQPDAGSSAILSSSAPPASLELFQVDNATFTRLKAYPSGFVQDAQSFLEKAKSQNLTFQSQLRSLLSDVRTRLDQEEQSVVQASAILRRLESERRFYAQELQKRQGEKAALEQQLAPLEADFQKANAEYQNFLSRRSVYQFQTDFKLDDYNVAPDQMYSNILRDCFDRFRTNIREEFLSWVTVVNFNMLTDYSEARREIPARLEAARILYPYVQNNLEGRPTRGLLVVFKARFDMTGIPDYTPGGNARGGLTVSGMSGRRVVGDESGVEWVFVQGGTFQMGSTDGDGDEKPIHSVTLNDFYMGKTEVTNAQFAAFLNKYGSDKVKSGEYAGQTMIYEHDWGVKKSGGRWQAATGYENHPVVYVTWYGANAFCAFYGFRLPTEAEWDYAARGGSNSRGTQFSGSSTCGEVAWYDGNSGGRTHAVGTKAANELGLFDMSGNVWEWCSDWYAGYGGGSQRNPQGPGSGAYRVLRGGSWGGNPGFCRVSNRSGSNPDSRYNLNGFRCSRNE